MKKDLTYYTDALYGYARSVSNTADKITKGMILGSIEINGNGINWVGPAGLAFNSMDKNNDESHSIFIPVKIKNVDTELEIYGNNLKHQITEGSIKNINGVKCESITLSKFGNFSSLMIDSPRYHLHNLHVYEFSKLFINTSPDIIEITDSSIDSFRGIPKTVRSLQMKDLQVYEFDYLPESVNALTIQTVVSRTGGPIEKFLNLCTIQGVNFVKIELIRAPREMIPFILIEKFIKTNDIYGAAEVLIENNYEAWAQV